MVDSYDINYRYNVRNCGGSDSATISVPDSSVKSYVIMNSSDTPVEEDSTYFISLTAVNNVNRSDASDVRTTTLEAGR